MKTDFFPKLVMVGLLLGFALEVGALRAADPKPLGIRLEHYEYPFPVSVLELDVQRQKLEMAYMDVRPEQGNGETVLLLHGKNFNGAYWERTAEDLAQQGFRVVIPDQIGFGKSSKPSFFHYTFHQLADNTRRLLDELDVETAHVLGHSMGGMLATRFVLMVPGRSQSLVLLNPIGLEDWKRKVPYPGVDQWYAGELEKTPEDIRSYMRESYYDGDWKPAYDEWLEILAGMLTSENRDRFAWNQALTYDMIFTQPVVHEFPDVAVPTLLLIGQRDRTALGKGSVPEEVATTLGNYPELGRKTAEAIPDATLVEFDDVGHLPHIEAYERFLPPLLDFLQTQ